MLEIYHSSLKEAPEGTPAIQVRISNVVPPVASQYINYPCCKLDIHSWNQSPMLLKRHQQFRHGKVISPHTFLPRIWLSRPEIKCPCLKLTIHVHKESPEGTPAIQAGISNFIPRYTVGYRGGYRVHPNPVLKCGVRKERTQYTKSFGPAILRAQTG